MKTTLLLSIFVFTVRAASRSPEGYTKYCNDLSTGDCRARGQRCFKVIMPLMNSLLEKDFLQQCADKFNVTGDKLEEFRRALSISFRDGGGYVIDEMPKEDRDLFLPYQACCYSMDGLLTDKGLNVAIMRKVFNESIHDIMVDASPKFHEAMVKALNSCPDSSLEEHLPDCLMPPCMDIPVKEETRKPAGGNQPGKPSAGGSQTGKPSSGGNQTGKPSAGDQPGKPSAGGNQTGKPPAGGDQPGKPSAGGNQTGKPSAGGNKTSIPKQNSN